MSTIFDQILLGIQVTFQIFFILYTIAVLYGIYRFLPKFGAELVTAIPQLLATGLKDTLSGIFIKQKMTDLGEKGNQVKAEKALLLGAISKTDPIKAVILPWIESVIESPDTGIPKYLRGTVNGIVNKTLSETPINFTEQLVPRVIELLDKRLPQLRLSERLKEIDQLQKVEKISE